MCSSRMGISRLVLLSSLLLGSQALARRTSRRFIGLPENGERVNYSNAKDNNKTLIIRHNLPEVTQSTCNSLLNLSIR